MIELETDQIIPDDVKVNSITISRSTHSTDTEPEVEGDNSPNIFHSLSSSTNYEIKLKPLSNSVNKSQGKETNVFDDFYEGIPIFEYDQQKIRRNQIKKKNKNNKLFYKIEMKNNRFLNYFDAFLNIAKHCKQNNQKFSRDHCKEYLKDCYIMDFSHDHYIPITSHLLPKQFNKYFRLVQREQKYL